MDWFDLLIASLLAFAIGMILGGAITEACNKSETQELQNKLEQKCMIVSILRKDIETAFWIGYLQLADEVKLTRKGRAHCEELISLIQRGDEDG